MTMSSVQAIENKVVIAHRGASGYLPEHTLPAKLLAYAQGADFIEQDLAMTKDGFLVVIHDPWLENITNVADVFPARVRDGHYYVMDFTLKEIEQLQVSERFRLDDEGNKVAVYPTRFPVDVSLPAFRIHTFAEEVALIQVINRITGKNVGIYPEIKAPQLYWENGLDITQAVLTALKAAGYTTQQDQIYLQSFDVNALLRTKYVLEPRLGMDLKLVQLLGPDSLGWLNDEAAMPFIDSYADGIGVSFSLLIDPRSTADHLQLSDLVKRAHEQGLTVHVYTLRADQLPAYVTDIDQLFDILYHQLDVDGIFTDFPDLAVSFLGDSATSAARASLNRNQRNVLGAINQLDANHPTARWFTTAQTSQPLGNLLTEAAGQLHADISTLAFEQSDLVRNAIIQHWRHPHAATDEINSAWGTWLNSQGRHRGDSDASGYKQRSTGLLLGWEHAPTASSRLGIAAGVSHGQFTPDTLSARSDSDHYSMALYAATDIDNWTLGASAIYSYHQFDSERQLTALPARLHAQYHAHLLHGAADISYHWHLDAWRLSPYVTLDHRYLSRERFSEQGNAAALAGDAVDEQQTSSTLGLRSLYQWNPTPDRALSLLGELGWQRQWQSTDRASQLRFRDSHATFTLYGAPQDQDAVTLNTGLQYHSASHLSLSLDYQYQYGQHYRAQGVYLGVTQRF